MRESVNTADEANGIQGGGVSASPYVRKETFALVIPRPIVQGQVINTISFLKDKRK